MDRGEILKISSTIPGTGGRYDYATNIYTMVNQMPENCTIIEIGTQNGGSAITMGLTIRDRGGHIYCVDPCFVKVENRPKDYDKFAIGGYSVEGIYELLDKYDLRNIITLLPGTSEEILRVWDTWPNKKFDLLFLDGDHTYDAMKIDILWEKYAKNDAVIMLDDWIVPVKQACDEYMQDSIKWKQRTDGTFWPIYYTTGKYAREMHK